METIKYFPQFRIKVKVTRPSHWSIVKRYKHIFRNARWLVLIVGLLMALGVELLEGHELSLETFAQIEVFVYGLLVPMATWLLLTLLARSMNRHLKSEKELERYHRFTRQLAQSQEWHELIDFVTRFPGAFLPVDRVSLFLYEHQAAELKFVAEWRAAGTTSPLERSDALPLCQECLTGKPLCVAPQDTGAKTALPALRAQEHCLRLAYGNVIVGVLKLHCRPAKSLTARQTAFMNSIASEIAIALALSIAYPRQMTQVRVEAQMDERRRLTYELHNSLAQQIGFAHLSLDRLIGEESLSEPEAVRQELERIRQATGAAFGHVRNHLAILRSWEMADLRQAIDSYAEFIGRQAQVEINLEEDGESRSLPAQLCNQIFSLVQEVLNNVAKHAQAHQAQIMLHWSRESLEICVVDNGVGFEPSTALSNGHYGLLMLREQAADLHGDVQIDSAPGQGTRVKLHIPLPARSHRRARQSALSESTPA